MKNSVILQLWTLVPQNTDTFISRATDYLLIIYEQTPGTKTRLRNNENSLLSYCRNINPVMINNRKMI